MEQDCEPRHSGSKGQSESLEKRVMELDTPDLASHLHHLACMVLDNGFSSLRACFITDKDDNDGRNPYLKVMLGRANETKTVKLVPSRKGVPPPAHTVPQYSTRAGPVLLHLLQPSPGCAPPY